MRPEAEYQQALDLTRQGSTTVRRADASNSPVARSVIGVSACSPGAAAEPSHGRACDLRYPDIINEIATHIAIVQGTDTIGFTLKEGCVEVSSYWKHWICLFPQHGPGRKHERTIELVSWQLEMLDSHRKALVRGLIHSDDSGHINEVERQLRTGPKRYRCSRCMFTNASRDILDLLTVPLDALGVHWTRTSPRDIAVSRREDVAFLDTFVDPKR